MKPKLADSRRPKGGGEANETMQVAARKAAPGGPSPRARQRQHTRVGPARKTQGACTGGRTAPRRSYTNRPAPVSLRAAAGDSRAPGRPLVGSRAPPIPAACPNFLIHTTCRRSCARSRRRRGEARRSCGLANGQQRGRYLRHRRARLGAA